MLTGAFASLYWSSTHWPALLPSLTKSEPRKDTYSEGSESTARSVRTTGILAALASLSTASQPVTTTGEKPMTSTFCLMKARIAAIWFSFFSCRGENFGLTPPAFAASWRDLVLSPPQPLSAPTWEKPRVIEEPEPEPESD